MKFKKNIGINVTPTPNTNMFDMLLYFEQDLLKMC